MAILRAQVVLPYLSNKPEDVAVNTWHFDSSGVSDTAMDVVRDHLVEFYNAPVAPALALSALLSNALNRTTGAAKIKVYDLAQPIPRPVKIYDWTIGPASTGTWNELPAEVALCGSFYSGRNLPRHRGRIYFGPFHVGALLDATNERSRPSNALVDTLAKNFTRLLNKAGNTQNLTVYSRVDNVSRLVTAGWVDDAWDTQRRRGQDAMARTLFAPTPI